tara:strand:- start:950 stop:2335 length:1386 start_codon:yes stop_codon:yes gene_type:complete
MLNLNLKNNYKLEICYGFFLFLLWWYLLGIKDLYEPFIGDDLHLVRMYSNQELVNVWFGNWDPDNIETHSYRPIAILFYHLQSLAFGEQTILHNLLSNIFQFFLIITIIIFFKKLNFSNIQLYILIPLLLFSKIFITLSAWQTLSPLILCYINFFLVSIYFLKWMDQQKPRYLFLILLFSFIALFNREEVYHLPFFIILVGLYMCDNFDYTFLKKVLPPFIITFSLVLIHFFLRQTFVAGASKIQITFPGIKGYLMSGVATGLPGGLFTTTAEEKILQITWLLSIAIMLIVLFKNKSLDRLLVKKSIIFFLIIGLLTSPMIIIHRDFGIFLPTVFTLAIISVFISRLLDLKYYNQQKKSLRLIVNFLVITILISGIVGGYKRSNEHLITWKYNTIYFTSEASSWIYDKPATIPKARREFVTNRLKKLGINEYIHFDELQKKIIESSLYPDLIIPNHFPLKY